MNVSLIALELVILLALSGFVSILIVNRYFSLKRHYQKHLLVVSVLVVNMICLLSITYLLPIDIWVHKYDIEDDPSNEEKIGDLVKYNRLCQLFDFIWLFVYWFQFVLCWFIIPIMMSYIDLKYINPYCELDGSSTSGVDGGDEQTQKKSVFMYKLKKSVLVNLKFYGICCVGIIAAIIYLKTLTQQSINIKQLLISLTHLYSITYTLILLAYGINLLPLFLLKNLKYWKRRYFYRSSTTDSLDDLGSSDLHLFVGLNKHNEEMNEHRIGIIENYALIMNPNNIGNSANSGSGVQEMFQTCKREVEACFISIKTESEPGLPHGSNNSNLGQRNAFSNLLQNSMMNVDETSSLHSLDELNMCYNKFMTEYYNYLYSREKFNKTLNGLKKLQSIAKPSGDSNNNTNNNRANGGIVVVDSTTTSRTTENFLSFNKTVIGLICLVLSIIVAFVEVVPVKFHSKVLFTESRTLLLQSMILFMYMTICCLFSLSKFKVSNFHLITTGNSNPKNALYYSLYSSRLLTPLCFNFSGLIRANVSQVFTSSFQKMLYGELYPVVLKLNSLLPTVIVVLVTVTYWFNLKDRLLIRLVGKENYYQLFGNYSQLAFSEDTEFSGEGDEDLNQDIEFAVKEGKNIFQRHINNYI